MMSEMDKTAATDAEFQARIAPFDPIRISPDGQHVAIRRGPNDWRVTNGGHYRDQHVADWTPLTRVEGAPVGAGDAAAAVARVEALAGSYGERGPESNGWLFVAAEGIRAAIAGDPS